MVSSLGCGAGEVDGAAPGSGEQHHTDQCERGPEECLFVVGADGGDGERPEEFDRDGGAEGIRSIAAKKMTPISALVTPSASCAGTSWRLICRSGGRAMASRIMAPAVSLSQH
ncbi:MAG: hypothetical protein JWR37_687 [Mycobacterium sp.]|jgi:hypothetical protein|nr:hypothetical protein [Mycobacterium sp.]